MKQQRKATNIIMRIQYPHSLAVLAGLLAFSLSGCGASTPAKEAALTTDKPAATAEAAAAPVADAAKPAETTASAATPPADAAAPAAGAAAPSQTELNTQLWDAARAGDAATVASLLQQGADVQMATASGETALHAAVAAGSLPIAVQLVGKGANVNAATSNGWTPLHHAARFSRADIANYLIQQGANPKATTSGSPAKTPVQMALDQGDLRTARILGY